MGQGHDQEAPRQEHTSNARVSDDHSPIRGGFDREKDCLEKVATLQRKAQDEVIV